MFCFADATGEALAALLRPGNARANNIADHRAVLDAAIAQLPAPIAAAHCDGGGPATMRRGVRADSAACSTRFAQACRARNVGFSVVARSNRQVNTAISCVAGDAQRWTAALDQGGDAKDRSAVAEVADLSAWSDGTRLIVRREPLPRGARTSLFSDLPQHRQKRPAEHARSRHE